MSRIPSSQNYDFQTIQAELIIREAFELIGISGSQLVLEQLEGAGRSINFLLSDLVNRNINLWTLKKVYLPLFSGKTRYELPSEFIKVISVDLRTSYINSIGKCFSFGGGDPKNAFDNNTDTSCKQTQANGYIGIDLDTPINVTFVGIKSATTAYYKLFFEGKNPDGKWERIYNNDVEEQYIKGKTQWFNCSNINSYNSYRIRETDGNILDIFEIYFTNQVVDTALSEISPYDYFRLPIKKDFGRPTIYSVDYKLIPYLNIWQAPDKGFRLLRIYYQSMIETLKTYTESLDIPNSFYQAIVYGLAKSLSMKYAPDKLQYIAPEFDRALNIAITKNTTTLPFNITLKM